LSINENNKVTDILSHNLKSNNLISFWNDSSKEVEFLNNCDNIFPTEDLDEES